MITLSSLKTAFSSYRYYYGTAPIGTQLPYLVVNGTDSDNFVADCKVYAKKYELTLSFYSVKKSETDEEAIEAILDNLGVIWQKSESFDNDQSFYLIIYTFWR